MDFQNGVRILETREVLNSPIEGMSADDRARILDDHRNIEARYCMEDQDGRWVTLLEGDRVFGPGSSKPFFEVSPDRKTVGRMKYALDTIHFV